MKKEYSIIMFLIVLLILSGFIIYKCFHENHKIKALLPSLLPGEKINYFDLTDTDAKKVDVNSLKENSIKVLIIFQRPCTPCDQNAPFYKKIAEVLKNDATIYGIVVDDISKAVDFIEKSKLNFPIYVPDNLNNFKKQFRLNLNLAQVIIYSDRIEHVQLGLLSSETAIRIIKLTRTSKKRAG